MDGLEEFRKNRLYYPFSNTSPLLKTIRPPTNCKALVFELAIFYFPKLPLNCRRLTRLQFFIIGAFGIFDIFGVLDFFALTPFL